MKTLYHTNYRPAEAATTELTGFQLREAIEKTRLALEIAYAGFDNVIDADLIDSYIYEINSLQKKYKNLLELAETQPLPEPQLYAHSPIRALVSHVFG